MKTPSIDLIISILIGCYILCSCSGTPQLIGTGEGQIELNYGQYGYLLYKMFNIMDTSYVYADMSDTQMKELRQKYMKKINKSSSSEDFVEIVQNIFNEVKDPLLSMYTGKKSIRYEMPRPGDVQSMLYARTFDTYAVKDCKEIDAFFVHHICKTNAAGEEEGNYILISFSNAYEKVPKQRVDSLIYAMKEENPSGYIIDLRSSGNIVGFEGFVDFFSYFYPLKGGLYYLKSLHSVDEMSFIGKNTIGENTSVYIIVNEGTVGLYNIAAYVLSSLPNVKIVSRSQSGGYGAICRTICLSQISNVYFTYPVIDVGNKEAESFYYPLRPDINVDWEGNTVFGRYDKCVEAAIYANN